MDLGEFFFLLFATIVTASAVAVITARNPVHSVLFLILAFFNAAGLFLLANAEFLALILVIVYVGAVAVLFLFVVMMLNINFSTLRAGMKKTAPLGGLVGFILLAEMVLLFTGYDFSAHLAMPENFSENGLTNTEALGHIMYTKYFMLFQLAGVILLVAMIGSIVLTLRHRPDAKKQAVATQVGRRKEKTVRLVNAKSGEGV